MGRFSRLSGPPTPVSLPCVFYHSSCTASFARGWRLQLYRETNTIINLLFEKSWMSCSTVRHVKWHPVASKWQTCPNFQLGIKWFQCWSHQQSRVKTCLCSVSVIPSSPSHSSARNKYSAFLAQMIVVSGMPFALGSDSWRGPDYKLGKAWLFHLKPVVSFVSPCWFISIKWLQ